MMICIEKIARDDHAVLCIQDFSSLLKSSTQVPLRIVHWLLESDILAMAMIKQQADGVSRISGACAFLHLTHTTPPHVDIFICSNIRIRAVGRRRQRPYTSLARYSFLSVSFAKKVFAHFFSRKFSFASKDIPTHFCLLNSPKIRHDQRTISCNGALATRDWPIYGGDQEKGGDRKPDKTKTDKTKSDKSKRENDKGLKKVKPPKRDGLVSLLQKGQKSLFKSSRSIL